MTNKKVCGMPQKLTQNEFIEKARLVHGNRYDYSHVKYKNSTTPVEIVCERHGSFWQRPNCHVNRGSGCPTCGRDAVKSFKYGVGIYDMDGESASPCYRAWNNMLSRCFSISRGRSYEQCTCDLSWLRFSNFYNWFHNNGEYRDGYVLDKDILGHCYYSPETCCFIPKSLNERIHSFSNRTPKRALSSGISHTHTGKYDVTIQKNGKTFRLGIYEDETLARQIYIQSKEEYARELAKEYYHSGMISERVYQGLLNYKFPIE